MTTTTRTPTVTARESQHELPQKAKRSRRLIIIVGILLAAIVAVALFVKTRTAASSNSASKAGVATTTAVIQQENLAQTESVTGTLDYAPTRPIVNQSSGTLTSRAADGTIVQRGSILYTVDAKPLVLLIGDTPAYRDMSTSSTDGVDIQQLEENLTALGYTGLTVDGHFDSATKAAVADFETVKGLDGDGTVQLGEVLFAPSPVRIRGGSVDVGSTVQPGSKVLDATATTKVVTASFTAAQASTAPAGTQVSVSLPDGTTTTGTITDVSTTAATSNSASGSAAGAGGTGAGGNGGQNSGGSSSTASTFTATISIRNSGVVKRVNSSTVTVVIIDRQKPNVLAAPVTALVALAEGGYAVQVVDTTAQGSHLVKVTTGMFTDSKVEVTGAGITAGTKVVVPQ